MEPTVFLHGFLGSPKDWEPVLSILNIEAICPSLPGHNGTPFTPHFDIDLPRFHLVAYSMGGRMALSLPKEKILSLTLLSVHPGLKTGHGERWESDLAWAKLLLELPIDEFLHRWYDQPLFKPFKPDFSMRRNHDPKELAKTLLHYSLAKQKYTPLSGVLVGERDTKFRALHPDGIVIPNAGHAIHLENPKAVADAIHRH
jgi:2-succinyl-6-hydroxy-2,4-cyclohexadiene-1-carboxylate synthase